MQTECDGGVSDYLCVCHGGRAQKQLLTRGKDLENRKERKTEVHFTTDRRWKVSGFAFIWHKNAVLSDTFEKFGSQNVHLNVI